MYSIRSASQPSTLVYARVMLCRHIVFKKITSTGHFAQNQPSLFLPGPAVLPLQHRRHRVQLDGRYFRHVPVAAAGPARPRAVLSLDVQQQRVLRAHGLAAELHAPVRRSRRAFCRAQRFPVHPAPVVPVVQHGHGHQGRDVLQPGHQGPGGLLELGPGIRARHAGDTVQRYGVGEFSQRSEGGQGARAEDMDAQQRASQIPVRQVESGRNQLQNNDGVHGRYNQRDGL